MIQVSSIASVYNEYIDHMYAYALHLGFDEDMAMDAIHDVFYKLCIRYNSLEKVENLKFYLFRSLKNRLIDIQRTSKEYTDTSIEKENICENMSFNLEVTVEDKLIDREELEEIRRKVKNILENLTDRQREIIYLRYIHEYTYEEIAELMHISVASCRNLISKSLTKLKSVSIPLNYFLLLISNLYS